MHIITRCAVTPTRAGQRPKGPLRGIPQAAELRGEPPYVSRDSLGCHRVGQWQEAVPDPLAMLAHHLHISGCVTACLYRTVPMGRQRFPAKRH